MPELTRILERLNRGERQAFEELLPLVYEELRERAYATMGRGRHVHTLQPTALVHEVFMKLVGSRGLEWQNSRHFYNAAAEIMRQILVSHARQKSTRKRGGDRAKISLENVEAIAEASETDWEALDRALDELRGMDERRYRVVMLRYFAGLSDEEVARMLEVSVRTVQRDWLTARTFLRARMSLPED